MATSSTQKESAIEGAVPQVLDVNHLQLAPSSWDSLHHFVKPEFSAPEYSWNFDECQQFGKADDIVLASHVLEAGTGMLLVISGDVKPTCFLNQSQSLKRH